MTYDRECPVIVPYKLAIKLKELGFNQICRFAYINNILVAEYCYNTEEYISIDTLNAAAPTIKEAFDWLFRNCFLACHIKPNDDGYFSFAIINIERSESISNSECFYKFYEKALDACVTTLVNLDFNKVT